MATPMTISTLQVDPLCNCLGCIGEVKKELAKFNDVELLATDTKTERGKFTISTANPPEEIKNALIRKYPKKIISLIGDMSHSNPLRVPDVNGGAIAIAMGMTMPEMNRLESAEYFKLNFANDRNQSILSSLPPALHNLRGSNGVHREYDPPQLPRPPPQTNIRPSAPPMPKTTDVVYGYPPEFYGHKKDHLHGCCTIV